MKNSIGVHVIQKCFNIRSHRKRLILNRVLVILLTYLAYTVLHATRKPFSALKHTLKGNTSIPFNSTELGNNATTEFNSENISNTTIHPEAPIIVSNFDNYTSSLNTSYGWAPFNNENSVFYMSTIDTVWSASYALSMFLTGHIAEKTSLKYSLFVSLVMSGITCASFGIAKYINIHHFAYFIVIQLFSGFFQSFGWPCVMAIMTNWFSGSKLGTITGIWGSHNYVGNIIGQLIASYFIDIDWAMSFILPGICSLIVGFAILFFLNHDLKSAGLEEDSDYVLLLDQSNNKDITYIGTSFAHPNDIISSQIEVNKVYKNESNSEVEPDFYESNKLSSDNNCDIKLSNNNKETSIGLFKALLLPGVIEYSLSLFFGKLVVYSFLFWLPYYINEVGIKNYLVTPTTAGYLASIFDVGSIIGSFLIGIASDYSKSPGILCVVSQIFGSIIILLYSLYGSYNYALCIVFLIISGIFVSGPASLITTSVSASLSTIPELKNQKAKATVAAIIDGTGAIGASIGPFIIKEVSKYGWNKVMLFLMTCVISSGFLLSRQFIREIRRIIMKLRK